MDFLHNLLGVTLTVALTVAAITAVSAATAVTVVTVVGTNNLHGGRHCLCQRLRTRNANPCLIMSSRDSSLPRCW